MKAHFVERRVKRKEYKAARSKNADWRHQFLSPSQEDLSTLAKHLEEGTIKPVLDRVWEFHSEDDNDG